MRSLFSIFRSLVVGLTGGPRIALGATIPPELTAYYATNYGGSVVRAVFLEYINATDYHYELVCDGGFATRATGWGVLNTNTGLMEVWEITAESFPDPAFPAQGQIIYGSVIAGREPEIDFSATSTLFIESKVWQIDGITAGRGVVAQDGSIGNSGAIGAEAVVLTARNLLGGGATDFLPGRAYRHTITGQISGSVANITTFRIRRNNAAGALVLGGAQFDAVAGSNRERTWEAIAVNNTAATITYTPVFTMQASGGTTTQVASATLAREYIVEDIGAAADFTNRPSV